MKLALLVVFGALFSIVIAGTAWNTSCPYSPKHSESTESAAEGDRRPVLVELFTSEGCSSCPPADRQLTFMQENQPVSGAEIITLAYHVDYWDRLGWKDRFSSSEFSERQNAYSVAKGLESNYTPQMIVDGDEQFVGSNGRKADLAVANAAKSSKGAIGLTVSDGKLKITIDYLPEHGASALMLAVAEDKLETKVRAGENSGSDLAHTGVVRSLIHVGDIAAADKKVERLIDIPSNADWNAEHIRYVVFVQEETSKKIIAVASMRSAK